MKKTFKALATASILALAATGAQALTTINGTMTSGGTAIATATGGSSVADGGFSWFGSPSSGWVEFTTTNKFDVFLTDYISGTNRSAMMLVNKASGAHIGTGVASLDATCNNANILSEINMGTCSFIGNAMTGAPAFGPDTDNPIYADVAAGTYYIGFYESNDIALGALSFSIAEVPLPVGGLMLFGARGGLAAAARRRKKA